MLLGALHGYWGAPFLFGLPEDVNDNSRHLVVPPSKTSSRGA